MGPHNTLAGRYRYSHFKMGESRLREVKSLAQGLPALPGYTESKLQPQKDPGSPSPSASSVEEAGLGGLSPEAVRISRDQGSGILGGCREAQLLLKCSMSQHMRAVSFSPLMDALVTLLTIITLQ